MPHNVAWRCLPGQGGGRASLDRPSGNAPPLNLGMLKPTGDMMPETEPKKRDLGDLKKKHATAQRIIKAIDAYKANYGDDEAEELVSALAAAVPSKK